MRLHASSSRALSEPLNDHISAAGLRLRCRILLVLAVNPQIIFLRIEAQ
jgi:hypothetical protein